MALIIVVVWLAALAWAAAARAGDWQFRLVADSGLPTRGATFGGTWADLDGDGHWDLVLSRHADGIVEFYLGRGDLRFAGPAAVPLPPGLLDHHGTAACDHDGDGDWDLFLSVGADRGQRECCKQLWSNQGALRFSLDHACDHLLADPLGRGRGALWLKLDAEPLPQLLILNYDSPPRLLGRDGGGDWHDLAGRVEAPAGAWWSVAVAEDFDGDGALDLFVAGSERRILRNAGGRLVPVPAASLAVEGPEISAAASGDVDGDGDPDLVIGLRGGALWLLPNESVPGEIRFGAVGCYPALPLVKEPVSVVLADLDNDGHLDLAVAQRDPGHGHCPPLLARGQGDGTFAPVAAAAAGLLTVPDRAMGMWALDLDRDGDLDLVVTNGEQVGSRATGIVMVYENLASTPGTTVELLARPGGAPHGLGARITLVRDGVETSRLMRGVANPWNATVLPVHFGLGGSAAGAVLTVDWAGGGRSGLAVTAAGGAWRLTEPEP